MFTGGTNFRSFKFKVKLLGNTVVDGEKVILRNTKIVVPLKSVNNFWRSLEMPLINCKVELKLDELLCFCSIVTEFMSIMFRISKGFAWWVVFFIVSPIFSGFFLFFYFFVFFSCKWLILFFSISRIRYFLW